MEPGKCQCVVISGQEKQHKSEEVEAIHYRRARNVSLMNFSRFTLERNSRLQVALFTTQFNRNYY